MKAIVRLRLKHDGTEYEPRDEVQEIDGLTKAEAADLVAAGVIELPAKKAAEQPSKPVKAEDKQTDDQKSDATEDGEPAEGGQ